MFPKLLSNKLRISTLINYRYHILSLFLLGLFISHTRNGQWVGDFWQHSAAVRELATNPLSPRHSQLLLDEPHTLYSPYSLGVAIFARIAKLDAITALSVAGIFNLILLLICLKLFVASLFPKYGEGVSFYTLMFTLLLWGREWTPWDFSGFLHLRVLGYVLPYPSTFAISLVFAVLSMYMLYMKERNQSLYFPILGVSIVILLSHPLSFIVLSIGLLAICLGRSPRSINDITVFLILLLLILVVSLLWPYYPVAKLVTKEASSYHADHVVLYQFVLKRIFPSLLGALFLLSIIKSNKWHPLGLMLAMFSLVYIFGIFSKLWTYGRVISFIILILHISLAYGIARIELRSFGRWSSEALQKTLVSLLTIMILIPYSYKSMIKPELQRAKPGTQSTYYQYEWLSGYVGQYDVVLADLVSSSLVPTFGGKVVAVNNALPFVNDSHERSEAVNRFFSDTTTVDERLLIADKYHVSFVLIDKHQDLRWQEITESTFSNSSIDFENEQFILISLQ